MKYSSTLLLVLLPILCNSQEFFSKKFTFSDDVGAIRLQQNKDFFNISGTAVPSTGFLDIRAFNSSIDKNSGIPIVSHAVSVENAQLYLFNWIIDNKDYSENINLLTRVKIDQTNEYLPALFFGDLTGFTNAVLLPEMVTGLNNCGLQKNNITIIPGGIPEQGVAVCFFDQTGELMQQRNYSSELSNSHFYDLDIYEDDFYLAGQVGSHSYLFKDKMEGGEFSYKIFDRILLEEIEVDLVGNIYATAVETYYVLGERFIRDHHLFKLNADLEILWTKTFDGAPKDASFRSLEITNTGEIIISFSPFRNLVNYHFRFNEEGDLLFKKGIPIGDQARWSEADNTVIIAANQFYSDSPFERNEFIIAKTNANIELPDCSTYDVCIEMTEGFEPSYFDLTFTPFEYTMEVQPLAIISEPIEFEVVDICYTIPPPRADFSLPDTLCRFEILLPTDIFNDTAEELNWQISGEGVDSIFTEFPENYSISQAGDYEVTQTVSFFGCTESYTRTINILDDLEVSFTTDSVICDSPPFIISAEGNRPLVNFLWDDSISTSTYQISETGNYGLIANDGYCKDTIEQFLRFAFPVGFNPDFSVGSDTSVCFDSSSPFIVRPTSNFTELFSNNDIEDSIFLIQNEGRYIFEAMVDEHCIFIEDILIERADCRSKIFLANAFSPNNDGVNDVWQALGKDFIWQELLIFDRWGNQIAQEKGENLQWDGRVRGELAAQGVYIFVLKYLNTLTGKEGQVSSDVTIIR